jgi:hypothetical protein
MLWSAAVSYPSQDQSTHPLHNQTRSGSLLPLVDPYHRPSRRSQSTRSCPLNLSARHRLCKWRPRRRCAKGAGKVLRLVHHQVRVGSKFHDGNRKSRRAIIRDDAFAHPQSVLARDPQHRKVSLGGVPTTLLCDRGAAVEPFA